MFGGIEQSFALEDAALPRASDQSRKVHVKFRTPPISGSPHAPLDGF
jgi:hypothetical protein